MILGLSFDYHDAAAALISPKGVVAAAHEERFTREKNDPSFPAQAIDFCLAQAGCRAQDLHAVVYYERPLRKFRRIVKTLMQTDHPDWDYFQETFVDWYCREKFNPMRRIARALKIDPRRVHAVEHHQSHAAAAFFCSPFDEAAVVTLDGVGEEETLTVSIGRGNSIRKLSATTYPHSIGLVYSAFTAYLGFEVNEGEYKVMGMAGFGSPVHKSAVDALFSFDAAGRLSVRQDYFNFATPRDIPFTQALIDRFGSPRRPEEPFRVPPPGQAPRDDIETRSAAFADIAASVQATTEDVILRVVEDAVRRTGLRKVCLSGGVTLNSAANGRLRRELDVELYVQPSAGDAGSALGAALHHAHASLNRPRFGPLTSACLGRAADERSIEAALENAGITRRRRFSDEESLVQDAAARLAAGQVLGWVQGRAEWGPRALGHRSILATPTRPDMKRIVNEKIKFREPFRPFAPSVIAGRAAEFFDMPPPTHAVSPEHFMLAVHPVRPERRADIPAVTHVDGTARVHLVTRQSDPLLYRLLEAVDARTGVPILVNTSFNLRGEPIVDSPTDAIRTFQWSGIDALYMGRYLTTKEDA